MYVCDSERERERRERERERGRMRERERKQVGSQGVVQMSRIEMLTRSILSHAKYGKALYAYCFVIFGVGGTG